MRGGRESKQGVCHIQGQTAKTISGGEVKKVDVREDKENMALIWEQSERTWILNRKGHNISNLFSASCSSASCSLMLLLSLRDALFIFLSYVNCFEADIGRSTT